MSEALLIDTLTGSVEITSSNAGTSAKPINFSGVSVIGIGAGGSSDYYTEMWTWTTKTTDANTAGQVGVNNAVAASVTVFNLNEKTTNNRDMRMALTELYIPGNDILIQQKTDSTKYARYTISSTPTDNGTWWSFPVTHVESGASLPGGASDTTVTIFVSGGGGTADKNYAHTQVTPLATWSVLHNLGKFPSVNVVDSGGSMIIPDVHYLDANNLQILFGSPTSGKAYLN